MTTDRAKREDEIVRTVGAVTLALVVASFGFVIFASGTSAEEAEEEAVEAPPVFAAAVSALGAARVDVAPTVVSPPEPPPKQAAAASSPRYSAPRQASAPVLGVAPAPAPRRVVVVRRSRAS